MQPERCPALTIERTAIITWLKHASAAARIVGHLDDAPAIRQVADHIDQLVHELSELLGQPALIAAPMPPDQAPAPVPAGGRSIVPALVSGAGGVR